jgi:Excalibur calcium-binding domain
MRRSALLIGIVAVTASLAFAPASSGAISGSTEVTSPSTSSVVVPRLYKNCTNFNKRYRHGVGRVGARDRTKSGDPVRNFLRSNIIYRSAMRYNDDLDRDNDKIACEKH